MDDVRYPIGMYEPVPFREPEYARRLTDIAQLPNMLEAAVLNLDEAQLQTPYRDGGWTIHQVVHHVADSHLNAYCRLKLTLTEHNPTVKAYDENEWLKTADIILPVNNALTLLHALHQRMHVLMKGLDPALWDRTYVHSGTGKTMNLWYLFGMYAWHGKHHVAHINQLRSRKGW